MSVRSGFCTACRDVPDQRGPSHDRCRLPGCRCEGHDADLRDKAASLTAPEPDEPVEEPRPLWDAVSAVAFAAVHLAGEAVHIEDHDAEESLRILYGLRAALEHIRDVEATLVRHIYLTGEHGDVRIDGLPPAQVRRGRDRKSWDAHGIARAVIDAEMDKRGGEAPEDPWEVASWLLNVLGVTYGRVTVLRDLGLEPDAFCETLPGKIGVSFVE